MTELTLDSLSPLRRAQIDVAFHRSIAEERLKRLRVEIERAEELLATMRAVLMLDASSIDGRANQRMLLTLAIDAYILKRSTEGVLTR
jgi:hypothetical protein